MDTVKHYINIDLAKASNRIDLIKIKKNDSESHEFIINLYNNSVAYNLSNLTAKLHCKKEDGNSVFQDCVIANTNGKLSAILETQTISYPGAVQAEVTVYGTSNQVLTSITFEFYVEDIVRDDSEIESTSSFSALTTALAQVTDFTNFKNELIAGRKGEASLTAKMDKIDSSLADIMNLEYGFFQKILATTTKIKLIGDSITEGVGATEHTVPTTNPIIFDNGVEVYREGDYTSRCWANYLREYIQANYPNVTSFVNAGIGGKSMRFAWQNAQYLVANDEDLVFVQLGTNDRSAADFEDNARNFLAYVKARCKNMIVMIANPTLNDDTTTYGMKYINEKLVKVCRENGYLYISHYLDMLDFTQKSGVELSYLVQSNGGSHPIDAGHLYMWTNIQNKLKFIDDQNDFSTYSKVSYLPLDNITDTTAIADFPYGVTFCPISNVVASTSNLPFKLGGTLKTFNSEISTDFAYQEYARSIGKMTYKRYWSNGAWTSWELKPFAENKLAQNYATNDKLIADFPIGVSYCVVLTASATGFPSNLGGFLVTYKVDATPSLCYQELFQADKNIKFLRKANTDGTWGTWETTNSGTVYTVSATFTAIASMTKGNVSIAAPITFDNTKFAYILSPKSILDSSLFFSYSHGSGNTALYISLFNASGASITPGTLEFELAIIRK